MKREQFEHAIRAAAAVLDSDELLVIGSQAIHATTAIDIPEAERSIEVDVAALEDNDGSKADLINASIGELSMFQASFGYYAQGVTPNTAVLPEGWRERLIPYRSENIGNVTAFCLDIHDLWLSKSVANREKDKEFCSAVLALGISLMKMSCLLYGISMPLAAKPL